ncbi:hypothetical protein [Paracoccus aminophilus]|uniref:Uncharacterized protein n=1 Tax=Paracoccus aminophilus JCM 7686 TaxID=1367847 RepID=S5XVD9_PARAH|nr:hypothetical protein [Paracoccus aminophilus]AGT11479.1 hypothetical protein JCM7686_pAMI6p149 [Paracoccus aminophilus JCM 7686]
MIRALLTLLPLALAPSLWGQTSWADEPGGLTLELNAVQDSPRQSEDQAQGPGACQLTVVTTNATGQAFDRAAWQVAVFDTGGVVRGLPVLDFGALTSGKTKVAVFELPGRPCAEIGRIVVNDVADCRIAGGQEAPDLCLNHLAARSLTAIAFGL